MKPPCGGRLCHDPQGCFSDRCWIDGIDEDLAPATAAVSSSMAAVATPLSEAERDRHADRLLELGRGELDCEGDE